MHIRVIDTAEVRASTSKNRLTISSHFSTSAPIGTRAAAEARMRGDVERAVDIAREPLFCFALFRAAADLYFFYARSHHICNDGFGAQSSPSGWRRFTRRGPQAVSLPYLRPVPGTTFWMKTSRTAPLPDTPRTATTGSKVWPAGRILLRCPASRRVPRTGSSIATARSRSTADALQNAGVPYGASLPQMLTATTGYYLHRLTGMRDMLLGIPVTVRSGPRMRLHLRHDGQRRTNARDRRSTGFDGRHVAAGLAELPQVVPPPAPTGAKTCGRT